MASVKLFELCSFTLLLMCFLWQVADHVSKFWKGSTTQSVTYEHVPLLFPDLTVCPKNGFKFHKLAELGLPWDYWNLVSIPEEDWLAPNNSQQADQWWNLTTYSRPEVILDAHLKVGREHFSLLSDVTEIGSFFMGNCFSISSNVSFATSFAHIQVRLNVSREVDEIYLFLHPKGHAPFVVSGVSVEDFREIDVKADEVVVITLKKEVVTFKHGEMCNEDAFDCIKRGFQGELACYLPQFKHWADGQALKVCSNATKVKHFSSAASVVEVSQKKNCGKMCVKEQFDAKVARRHWGKPRENFVNTAHLRVFYSDTSVEKTEEILLYDLSNIVSAVGGSLGLFLGFSCLNFVTCFYKKVRSKENFVRTL